MFHLLVPYHTGLLEDRAAAREHDEVGYAADLKARRELGVSVRIDFQDQRLARHIGGGACYFGRGGAAGTAPFSPEVDQDWYFGILDDVVEESRIDREWRIQGWKWIFAGAAAPGVGEVFGGDAIFLIAMSARADDWHGIPFRILFPSDAQSLPRDSWGFPTTYRKGRSAALRSPIRGVMSIAWGRYPSSRIWRMDFRLVTSRP
jgi:hypothetical protein